MGRHKKAKGVHDSLVYRLLGILDHRHNYQYFIPFMDYNERGLVGEVDILALAPGVHDFYEVKSTYHPKARKKAEEQFERFQRAFPRWKSNGFMYTKDNIIRRL